MAIDQIRKLHAAPSDRKVNIKLIKSGHFITIYNQNHNAIFGTQKYNNTDF